MKLKSIIRLTVLVICTCYSSLMFSQIGGWSGWQKMSCFTDIEYSVKLGTFLNGSNGKTGSQEYLIKFRNSSDHKIDFSYNIMPLSIENKVDRRWSIGSGKELNPDYFFVDEGVAVKVVIGNVCHKPDFACSLSDYEKCGGGTISSNNISGPGGGNSGKIGTCIDCFCGDGYGERHTISNAGVEGIMEFVNMGKPCTNNTPDRTLRISIKNTNAFPVHWQLNAIRFKTFERNPSSFQFLPLQPPDGNLGANAETIFKEFCVPNDVCWVDFQLVITSLDDDKNSKYEELLKKAEEAESKNDYEGAISFYSQANQLKPSEPLPKNKIDYLTSKKKKAIEVSKTQLEEQNKIKQRESQKADSLQQALKKQEEERLAKANKEQFEKDKQAAYDKNREYREGQKNSMVAAGALSALWAGFYIYNTPVNSVYEGQKSNFFSIGPTNGITILPVVSNSVSTTGFVSTNYSTIGTNTVGSSYYGDNISVFNFGMKSEFGRIGRRGQFSIPIRAQFGLLPSQYIFNAGGGINTFFGKKIRLGLCYEYNFYNGQRYDNLYQDDGYSYTNSDISSYPQFGTNVLKVGIRYNSGLSHVKINKSSPFIIDLFLTLNAISNYSYYYGSKGDYQFINTINPGFEFNISKLNAFGVFGKIVPMLPMGTADYTMTSQPSYNLLFMEFGIKREYTWIKPTKNSYTYNYDGYDEKGTWFKDKNKSRWAASYYLNAGYTIPTGNWAKQADGNNSLSDLYIKNSGIGAKGGVIIDNGFQLYFKKLKLNHTDRLKLGTTLGLQFAYNPISWKNLDGIFANGGVQYDGFYFYSAKLGGRLSWSSNSSNRNRLTIEANVLPTLSDAGKAWFETNKILYPGFIYSFSSSGRGIGLLYDCALDYKIGRLNIGASYVFGQINYKMVVEVKDINDNKIIDDKFNSYFTPSAIRLKAGLNF